MPPRRDTFFLHKSKQSADLRTPGQGISEALDDGAVGGMNIRFSNVEMEHSPIFTLLFARNVQQIASLLG
ncbi:hypothetical protein RHOFW104R3_01685 [Rhodanobacter denitrificans]|nr:hypothetical protein RHOFW104R3_01685 [Rhodanobacter denitrificans]